jgi:hypothetical protein
MLTGIGGIRFETRWDDRAAVLSPATAFGHGTQR